jgi:ATP-dependent Clp protease ATP-binding subunit ClpA
MDHGTLTDTNGKQADFRQVILLMTSNVGAREMAQRSVGFGDVPGRLNVDGERAVERLFSPEFRNRLDARLQFNALTPAIMEMIVDKMIGELRVQLVAKKVEVELTPAGRKLLADKGFDPAFGARPLARVIEEEIKRPLTDELLFGKLAAGGRVAVDAAGKKLALRTEPDVPAASKEKTDA